MERKPRKQTFPEGVALSTVREQQGFREGQDPRGRILFASKIRVDPDERMLSGMGRQKAAQRWTKNERTARPQTQPEQTTSHSFSRGGQAKEQEGEETGRGQGGGTSEDGMDGSGCRGWTEVGRRRQGGGTG